MDMQETRDRMCPYCRNRAGVALGRILASATGGGLTTAASRAPRSSSLLRAQLLMIRTELSAAGSP